MAQYIISDGNAIEYANTLEEAAEIAQSWYEYLEDDPDPDNAFFVPIPDLDDSNLEALNDSISEWEDQISKEAGYTIFQGHGNYAVSPASQMGLNLTVSIEADE